MMLDCSLAKKYYRIAVDAAANDEERAKAVFLAIKCDRNAFYLAGFHKLTSCDADQTSGDGGFDTDANTNWIRSNGFSEFKRYAHTQYYKDVIRECGYFRRNVSQ